MNAPRLALLHGFTGAPSSWDSVVSLLPRGVQLARPWLPGHGPSAEAPLPRNFEAAADHLATELSDSLAIPFHLAGYSLGARVGLGLLARHPRCVASATLISVHPGLAASERAQRVRDDAAWTERLENEGLETFARHWEAQPILQVASEVPKDRLESRRRERRTHSAGGLAAALRVLGLGVMPDWRPALKSTEIRVQLLVGAQDHKFRSLASEMARISPRISVRVVPDAGHDVLLERPEAVAQTLQGVVS